MAVAAVTLSETSEAGAGLYRHGPHMCQSRYGNGCCLGWNRTRGSGLCVIPVCSLGCGNGYCVAPNLCFCRGGQQGISCSDDGRPSHLFSDTLLNHSDIDGSLASCLNMHCGQSCALIGGMPICSCYVGYSLGKNGRTCYDVDECSRYGGQSLCQQICTNNIGSYRCLCYQGYRLLANGHSCVSSKYFRFSGVSAWCGEYGCDMSCNHGGCEEVSRVCPDGFTMIETSIGISCKDIDECSTASCKGQCVNKEGGFVCDCGAGMQLSPDKHSCVDIDECAGNQSLCQQRCQNVMGSFKCSCWSGYYLHNNGHLCTDVNECRWDGESRVCHHSCHNTFGSYLCSCRAGFRLQVDRKTCEDIDECKEDVSLCKSRCLNVVGSYRCTCLEGFQMVKGLCLDIDECEAYGHTLCEHKCINTIGSFKCTCPLGYEMHIDGQMCITMNVLLLKMAIVLITASTQLEATIVPVIQATDFTLTDVPVLLNMSANHAKVNVPLDLVYYLMDLTVQLFTLTLSVSHCPEPRADSLGNDFCNKFLRALNVLADNFPSDHLAVKDKYL
ncbi:fibulin-1-like [Narcine bancroftii]|uniref:fibulin-1-like n=1 Tax=Narcine bancroftii TaxID=1343680 RepID=UPI003831DF36